MAAALPLPPVDSHGLELLFRLEREQGWPVGPDHGIAVEGDNPARSLRRWERSRLLDQALRLSADLYFTTQMAQGGMMVLDRFLSLRYVPTHELPYAVFASLFISYSINGACSELKTSGFFQFVGKYKYADNAQLLNQYILRISAVVQRLQTPTPFEFLCCAHLEDVRKNHQLARLSTAFLLDRPDFAPSVIAAACFM
jgi:hypothetical protein